MNLLRWEIRKHYEILEKKMRAEKRRKRDWDPGLDYPDQAPNAHHNGGPLCKWGLGLELSPSDIRWLEDRGYLDGGGKKSPG